MFFTIEFKHQSCHNLAFNSGFFQNFRQLRYNFFFLRKSHFELLTESLHLMNSYLLT